MSKLKAQAKKIRTSGYTSDETTEGKGRTMQEVSAAIKATGGDDMTPDPTDKEDGGTFPTAPANEDGAKPNVKPNGEPGGNPMDYL